MNFFKFIKNRTDSFYNIASNCKICKFAQHYLQLRTISLQSMRQLLNGNNGQLRTPILTLGKVVKLQAIRRLCKSACDHADLLTS